MYLVRVMNHKNGKVEYLKVTAEELCRLYRSIWYDIFDVQQI